jgi:Subtilase family
MSGDIAWLRSEPDASGPWVVVNAWALFDRSSDLPGAGGVGSDGSHPFHGAVQGVTATGSDVVFVAGNCGQYCPDDRCGASDIGPGYSISGPSAYAEVLTVGAVRVDGLPLGYSSQGPGLIATNKPELCAPSNFSETFDPGQINSGTSAACAVAAGVVAALRTRATVSPADMIVALNQGTGGTSWDPQFGYGTLNAAATRGILGI